MKRLLPALILTFFIAGVAYAATVLPIIQGGTGASSFGTSNGIVSVGSTGLTSYSGYTLSSTLFTAANASTTQLSAASAKFYVAPTGKQIGYDTVHSWSGTVSPTRAWSTGLATSTPWLATSTAPYNLNAQMVLPFSGTLRQAVCNTNAGTLTVQLTLGGTSYYIAGVAVTPATTTFSGVTFGEGAKFSMNAGKPVSSPQSVVCTLYATQS